MTTNTRKYKCSACGEDIQAYKYLLYSHGGEYLDYVFKEHDKVCKTRTRS